MEKLPTEVSRSMEDGRRHLNGRPKRVSKLPTIDDDDFVLNLNLSNSIVEGHIQSNTVLSPDEEDDDLPVGILKTSDKQKQWKAGDLAWIKYRKCCFWPCYIKSVHSNKVSAYFISYNKFEEKERPYRCSVTSKNIRRYSSKECKVLVEQGKEHLRQMKENHGQSKVGYVDNTSSFNSAVELADMYMLYRSSKEFKNAREELDFFRTNGRSLCLKSDLTDSNRPLTPENEAVPAGMQNCDEQLNSTTQSEENKNQEVRDLTLPPSVSNASYQIPPNTVDLASNPSSFRTSSHIPSDTSDLTTASSSASVSKPVFLDATDTTRIPSDTNTSNQILLDRSDSISTLASNQSPPNASDFTATPSTTSGSNNALNSSNSQSSCTIETPKKRRKRKRGIPIEHYNTRAAALVEYITDGNCDQHLMNIYNLKVDSWRMETYCKILEEPLSKPRKEKFEASYFHDDTQLYNVSKYLRTFIQSNVKKSFVENDQLLFTVFLPEATIYSIQKVRRKQLCDAIQIYKKRYSDISIAPDSNFFKPLTAEERAAVERKNKELAKKLKLS